VVEVVVMMLQDPVTPPIVIVPVFVEPAVELEVVFNCIRALLGTVLFTLIAVPFAVAVNPLVSCETVLVPAIPLSCEVWLAAVLAGQSELALKEKAFGGVVEELTVSVI
jgi:hypothetical protein